MAHSIETLIVGAGQAGLSLSYYLTQQGREHLIIDRALQPAEAWRNQRWDSFTLNTPNELTRLPGADYQGSDPDGFLSRVELIRFFEDYLQRFNLPVRFGIEATSLTPNDHHYTVTTTAETFNARNVVIATGLYQSPKVPPFAANLSASIHQVHSSEYRSPDRLPSGAVLVVGSGQSGCQIAEELYQLGRKVYLSVGRAGRVPRRYRGKDMIVWLNETGFFDRTADQLPSSQARFSANPQLSGSKGGHTINLHQFVRDGVTLVGHIGDVQVGKLRFAPDLRQNLLNADEIEATMLHNIDNYIRAHGLDAPPDNVPVLRDAYDQKEIAELDVRQADITSIIWAGGYSFSFDWVKLPLFDADGFPIQQRGATAYPGLYFLGLPWLHTQKSGLIFGVGDDAAYIASRIQG
ncbi:MAG TPA: NAD(P)/FAD-dependent oxidoreductase [Aggregatilineaceae bacterium]|nr:NAD(P)/FAD-dependent oxidoreductase [Aggregatilineaceae bacterium]